MWGHISTVALLIVAGAAACSGDGHACEVDHAGRRYVRRAGQCCLPPHSTASPLLAGQSMASGTLRLRNGTVVAIPEAFPKSKVGDGVDPATTTCGPLARSQHVPHVSMPAPGAYCSGQCLVGA